MKHIRVAYNSLPCVQISLEKNFYEWLKLSFLLSVDTSCRGLNQEYREDL